MRGLVRGPFPGFGRRARREPPVGTPSLILDFVADGNDPWPTLSLDFSADAYRVDEGDPTAGNEHINIQVWS